MEQIVKAANQLNKGFLVAFPTETVYGLGADATNENAVLRIFEVKNRPSNHPLIVHIGSINELENWTKDVPEYAYALARKYWPGPMTLILIRSKNIKDFVTGGQDTVGIRIPNNETALLLLKEFKKIGSGAIAAPSANKFGKVSPTSYQHVVNELSNDLGENDMIIDGGNSEIGLESTIIDCTSEFPRILRPGAISEKQINEIIQLDLNNKETEMRFSGSFKSHYAPNAKVLLDEIPKPGDGLIAMNDFVTPKDVIRIGAPENIEEFARNLYSDLRKADELNLKRVIVIQPQGDELAVAIRDRLKKASH